MQYCHPPEAGNGSHIRTITAHFHNCIIGEMNKLIKSLSKLAQYERLQTETDSTIQH